MCLKKTLKPLIFHAPWSPHMWKNCYYQHSLNLWPHTVQPTGSHSRQRTWLCGFFSLYSVWIIRPKMGTPDWVYGKSKKNKTIKQIVINVQIKYSLDWTKVKAQNGYVWEELSYLEQPEIRLKHLTPPHPPSPNWEVWKTTKVKVEQEFFKQTKKCQERLELWKPAPPSGPQFTKCVPHTDGAVSILTYWFSCSGRWPDFAMHVKNVCWNKTTLVKISLLKRNF